MQKRWQLIKGGGGLVQAMGQVKKSIEFRRRIGQQAKTLRTGQFHLDDGKQLSE